ncbi:MAG TPA: apolipoprotein N-acyltransferase [Streptosporangiaceae bacterium]|nr:apolipoprotein N-acyltransferase [Streptosporangiaceae bacterium]
MAFWRGFAQPVRYAALLAGALPVLAFPAPNLEFLAWIGLVPGLLLLRAAPSGREAAIRGWWFGAGYLLAALYWLSPNLGPGLLLVVIVLGAPWAGVGYAAWRLLRGRAEPADKVAVASASARTLVRTVPGPGGSGPATPAGSGSGSGSGSMASSGEPAAARGSSGAGWFRAVRQVLSAPAPSPRQALAAMIVLPSAWVVIDWIRSWQGIGGPWAVFGASQWRHPVVLALAAVGGIWLISFALLAANTGFVIALTSASRIGRAVGIAGAGLAIAACPLAFLLTSAEFAAPPSGHLTLALVQPGLENGPAARLAAGSALTRDLPAAGPHRSDLIVWGESSVGYDLATDKAVLARVVELSDRTGTQLLVSQDALSPSGAKSKVAVLIGPAGVEGTYVKTRLVPFGEYIPFRSVLGWLTAVSRAASQNMIAGNGAHVLHAMLPNGRPLTFGVLICFESSFPDMSAVDTNHGAQALIYQTSDSTFQGSWALPQHASLAAIRAAETGRPAVQAALTGDSAAFDSRGRLLDWMGPSRHGVLRVRLTLPDTSARTPFDRFGDYVPWFAIGSVAVAVLYAANGLGLVRRLRRS